MNITIVRAPGAYELPLEARRLAESKNLMRFQHCVRSNPWRTFAHFELAAGEASSGLGQVAMQAEIPGGIRCFKQLKH